MALMQSKWGEVVSNKQGSLCYRAIKRVVSWVYPKVTSVGVESLPDEPSIIVGNHSQLHGPIISELHIPVDNYTWCVGEMMKLKEVPAYAFRDFWSFKPWYSRWFYKIVSYLIAPLSVLIFNNAHTIAVYRDARLFSTFTSCMILRIGLSMLPSCTIRKPARNCSSCRCILRRI